MRLEHEDARAAQRVGSASATPREAGEPRAAETGSSAPPVALSVVIPVRNDPGNLERCLRALGRSQFTEFESIVVDDASIDDTADVASRHGVRLIRLPERSGPAAARNVGAEAAVHPFLFFLDADVAVQPGTLGRVAERFGCEPPVDAFFGSYDAQPGAPDLVSQYRNLLHHHVHQTGNELASTFWSGCGAIRKDLFQELGGFDTDYDSASIEDIELGSRLLQRGHRIELVKSIQVQHLKRWSLWRMIRCDIEKRGIPWTRLILRQGRLPNDLNLRRGQRWSGALSAGVVLALVIGIWRSDQLAAWWLLSACLALAVVLLNRPFFALLTRVRGLGFAIAAVPLHLVYYLCGGIALVTGVLLHLGHRLSPGRADSG